MKPLHDYTGRVCSSLFGIGNAGDMQQVFAAAFTDLVARVEALEAAQNLQQRDEDTERAAPTVKDSLTVHFATDEELSQLYYEACGGHEDSLRAVYDLGRKHGATQAICPYIRSSDEGTSYCALAEQSANSKPTPNFAQISSSADTGLLPMIVSETGSDDEPETERIICSAISGGADYVNGMPRELFLERTRYGLHIGSLRISARYAQVPAEVAEPHPAPADGLVEVLGSVPDVWSAGKPLHPAARRAAIHHIADWLEQRTDTIANGSQWAAMLREEAGR